jgi:hypothetical protein
VADTSDQLVPIAMNDMFTLHNKPYVPTPV